MILHELLVIELLVGQAIWIFSASCGKDKYLKSHATLEEILI